MVDWKLLLEAMWIGLKETLFGKPKPKHVRRVRKVRRPYVGYYDYFEEDELLAGFQAEWGDPTEPIDDFLADWNGGSL